MASFLMEIYCLVSIIRGLRVSDEMPVDILTVTDGRSVTPCLVVKTTTPLAALAPYKAVASASFNTVISFKLSAPINEKGLSDPAALPPGILLTDKFPGAK